MIDGEEIINLIHREAHRAVQRVTRRTPAVVDSYDKKLHAVKLKLMPDSMDGEEPVITGWIPLHPPQTGNGFGFHIPPNIGDPGWLEYSEFDREAANFTHAVFNDKFPPDKTVEAGEWKYIHKTKSYLYFNQNGDVWIVGKNGDANHHMQLNNDGSAELSSKAGNKTVHKADGTVQVIPTNGKIVFLGGTGSDGSYDWVVTNSGNSINVKARYA